jgi:hypothetical protein
MLQAYTWYIFFFTVNDVIIYRKKICNLTIDNDLHLNSQPWINIQERYQFFTVEVLPRVLNVPCVVQKQGLSLKEENVYLNARQLFLFRERISYVILVFLGGPK